MMEGKTQSYPTYENNPGIWSAPVQIAPSIIQNLKHGFLSQLKPVAILSNLHLLHQGGVHPYH